MFYANQRENNLAGMFPILSRMTAKNDLHNLSINNNNNNNNKQTSYSIKYKHPDEARGLLTNFC